MYVLVFTIGEGINFLTVGPIDTMLSPFEEAEQVPTSIHKWRIWQQGVCDSFS